MAAVQMVFTCLPQLLFGRKGLVAVGEATIDYAVAKQGVFIGWHGKFLELFTKIPLRAAVKKTADLNENGGSKIELSALFDDDQTARFCLVIELNARIVHAMPESA